MLLYDLVVFNALSDHDDLKSRNRVLEALRSAGAVSPASARHVAELDIAADDTWRRLVVEGRVREGPPNYFYRFDPPRPSTRQRIAKMAFFYTLIVLIPVVLVLLSRKGH